MMKFIFSILLLHVSVLFANGQDIIYKISGIYNEQKVALDSIMVENLTNHTQIVFGNLPPKEEYNINLGERVGIENISPIPLSTFDVHSNLPGLLQLKYKLNIPGLTNISVYNVSGQLIRSSNGVNLNPGSVVNIVLGQQGIYFVRMETGGKLEAFKAIGTNTHQQKFSIQLSNENNSLSKRKSTEPPPSFSCEMGDSLRISVFKEDYFAWPALFKVTGSEDLDFHLKISSVKSEGISDAYVPIDENTTDVTSYDHSTGELNLSVLAEAPEFKPGSIITVNLDSTYVLRKVIKATVDGNTIKLETRQAYLNELFIDKSFKLHTGFISTPTRLKSAMSPSAISAALTDDEGFIHPYEVIYKDRDGNHVKRSVFNTSKKSDDIEELPIRLIEFDKPLGAEIFKNKTVNFYSTDESNLHFHVDFCAEYEFDPALGEITEETKIEKGDIIKYDFWLEGNANLIYKLALEINKSFEKSPRKAQLLADIPDYTANFMIGLIPVSIEFENGLYYNYEVDADANLKANWGFEYDHTLKLGASYNNEKDEFSIIKGNDSEMTFYPLELEGNVEAYARVEVFPKIAVKLYSIFGPYFEIVPFLDGNFNMTGNFSTYNPDPAEYYDLFAAWDARFGVGLDFRVGAKLDLFLWFDAEFGPAEFHLLKDDDDPEIYSKAIYDAPRAIHLTSIIPDKINKGETIPLKLKVTNFSVFNRLDDMGVPFCPIYLEGDGEFSKKFLITDAKGNAEVDWTPKMEGNNISYARIFKADKSSPDFVELKVNVENDFSASSGNFTDGRDGRQYKWVKIGDQVWMAENLKYLPYNSSHGISPPSEPDIDRESNYSSTYLNTYYYVYGYDGINPEAAKSSPSWSSYGVLYNYAAANISCPDGWKLPSSSDWEELAQFIANRYGYTKNQEQGFWNEVGKHLKSTSWNGGTDDFGFNALPGGMRDRNEGDFRSQGGAGYWWSSSAWYRDGQLIGDCSYCRTMSWDNNLYGPHLFRQYGMSVRCIKND